MKHFRPEVEARIRSYRERNGRSLLVDLDTRRDPSLISLGGLPHGGALASGLDPSKAVSPHLGAYQIGAPPSS
jgi:hypothetical protein